VVLVGGMVWTCSGLGLSLCWVVLMLLLLLLIDDTGVGAAVVEIIEALAGEDVGSVNDAGVSLLLLLLLSAVLALKSLVLTLPPGLVSVEKAHSWSVAGGLGTQREGLGREGERAQTAGNRVEGRTHQASGRGEKATEWGHSPLFPPIARAQFTASTSTSLPLPPPRST
jgi:hypothetical protein